MADESPHWTPGEVARLRALFEAGRSDSQIADELPRRSERAVAQKRYLLGLVRSQRVRRTTSTAGTRRCSYLQNAVELAISLADCRTPHDEIADELRTLLARAPA